MVNSMVLLTSVWNNDSPSCHAALDVVSRAYPVVWEEHLQTRSQSLIIGTSRLGDQTHRLHDGKKHRWSWLVWVQTEETEDLDDQGVRIPDQVRKIIPENRNYITDAWSSSSSHTHSSIERKKSTDSSGSVLKINLEICWRTTLNLVRRTFYRGKGRNCACHWNWSCNWDKGS